VPLPALPLFVALRFGVPFRERIRTNPLVMFDTYSGERDRVSFPSWGFGIRGILTLFGAPHHGIEDLRVLWHPPSFNGLPLLWNVAWGAVPNVSFMIHPPNEI